VREIPPLVPIPRQTKRATNTTVPPSKARASPKLADKIDTIDKTKGFTLVGVLGAAIPAKRRMQPQKKESRAITTFLGVTVREGTRKSR
jgi:hypothetical protein